MGVYPIVFWGTTIYLDSPHIVLGLDQLFWTGISFLKNVDGQPRKIQKKPSGNRHYVFCLIVNNDAHSPLPWLTPSGALEYHESNLIQVLSKHIKTHIF